MAIERKQQVPPLRRRFAPASVGMTELMRQLGGAAEEPPLNKTK
jgi:hypothetical protein